MIKTLLALVLGGAIGFFGCMAYFGSVSAKSMLMSQEMEIYNFEQAAENAYRNQPPEVAIWALEYYIKSLYGIKEQRSSVEDKNPYLILLPDISIALSHGRLSQLYKQIDNQEKYKYHLEKAIALYSEKGVDTEEKLIERIKRLDEFFKQD